MRRPKVLLSSRCAFVGFEIVGPLLPVDFQRGRSRRFSARTGGRSVFRRSAPVLWRIHNAPNIAMRIQRRSDQKAVIAERQAVGNSRCHAASARKIPQDHRRFQLQCARTAKPTSLRACHQHHTFFRKRTLPIQTRDRNWNLDPQAGASTSRFRRQHFHNNEARPGAAPSLLQNIYCTKGDKGNHPVKS